MTVDELIEELQKQPNRKVPVRLKEKTWDGQVKTHEIDLVRFEGPHVVLEA